MTVKPPIREEMYSRPGVLSTIWAKFFARIEKDLTEAEDNIIIIEETIDGGSSGLDEEILALNTKINVVKSTDTITTTPDSEGILTLYWMGV